MNANTPNSSRNQQLPSFQELIQYFAKDEQNPRPFPNVISRPTLPRITNPRHVQPTSAYTMNNRNNGQFGHAASRLLSTIPNEIYNFPPRSYPVANTMNYKPSPTDTPQSLLSIESKRGKENLLHYLENYYGISRTSMIFAKAFSRRFQSLNFEGSHDIKDTSKEELKSFLHSFEANDLDNQIACHEKGVELLHIFKIFLLNSHLQETPKPVTQSSKSAISDAGRTEHRRKSHPQSFNELLPLKVNANNGVRRGHSKNFSFGGLNKELSQRPDILCQHCGSKDTPEWRRGPMGSRTLCNACGLFYSKLIKKFGLREADVVMKKRKTSGAVKDRRVR